MKLSSLSRANVRGTLWTSFLIYSPESTYFKDNNETDRGTFSFNFSTIWTFDMSLTVNWKVIFKRCFNSSIKI